MSIYSVNILSVCIGNATKSFATYGCFHVFRAGVWEDNDSTLNVKCYDDPNQPNTINDVQSKDDAGISYLFHGYKLVIQFLYPN